MSVMITGAGLVGAQIACLEQEAGHTPVIFDSAPRTDALADFVDVDRCVVVRGDVTNPLDLVGAVQANDVRRIIHTAAFGGLRAGSNVAPLSSTQVNVMGTAHVLEIARIFRLERVVLSSSSDLYLNMAGGQDKGAWGYEEAYPRPSTVYAANKQAAEGLGRAYRETFGLDVVVVRYPGVFGPWRPGGGGRATSEWETWLRSVMAGQPAQITIRYGDWIYSKDAAKGTHLACWAEGLEDQVFNLSMGRVHTSDDVADAINAAIPGGWAKATPSPGAEYGIMNIDRARKQLRYEVGFPMEVAVRDYCEWLGEHPTSSQVYREGA